MRLQIFRVVIVEIPVAAGLALDEDERDREQNGHERGEQPAVMDGLDRCNIVVAAVQERRQKQGQHPQSLDAPSFPCPCRRLARPYHTPMNTPKQA